MRDVNAPTSHGDAAVDDHDDDGNVNVYTTVQLYVQFVDVMCSVGLSVEGNHALLSYTVESFYRLVRASSCRVLIKRSVVQCMQKSSL